MAVIEVAGRSMTDLMEVHPAWVAGLFDGEGCILVDTTLTLVARVCMTDENAVATVAEFMGRDTFYHYPNNGGDHYKDQYHAVCHNEDAFTFLKSILPYLIVKAWEAEEVLKYKRYFKKHQKGGKPMTENTKQKRKDLREKLQHIKRL